MGRHRKHPLSNGNIAPQSATGSVAIREDIESRIGLDNQICLSCNANNSPNANKCRKCGHTNLRQKASDYQGKGSENSGSL